MHTTQKNLLLVLVLVAIAVSITILNSKKAKVDTSDVEIIEVSVGANKANNGEGPNNGVLEEVKQSPFLGRTISLEEKKQKYEPAKEITTLDAYINTNGQFINISDLVGKKVILIDFWTYSCINCQRTTPYLNSWYEKYDDKGLEIIGIHTPEFDFEKDQANVEQAVKSLGIQFPVVMDNDYSTWTAYRNRYWPRKYLIDIDGFVVYDHIGEGAYEETEKKIQELLSERNKVLGIGTDVNVSLTKETAGLSGYLSPETYFGSNRNEYLGNGDKFTKGNFGFEAPTAPQTNTLYFFGNWKIEPEYAESNQANVGFVYKYNAQNVFMVAESDTLTRIIVTRDGQPLGDEAGSDVKRSVSGETYLEVGSATLYKVIEDNSKGTHTLEFKVESPGLRAYTFTFG